jgi:hypothetical protein
LIDGLTTFGAATASKKRLLREALFFASIFKNPVLAPM